MSTFDLLAVHRTIAVFVEIRHQPCRFMTSLCPDHCNHAKDVAVFKIETYTEYAKMGEYGDDKADEFYVSLNQNDPEDAQTQEIIDQIRALTPGAKVELGWDHIYVHDDAGSRPRRPVKVLTVMH